MKIQNLLNESALLRESHLLKGRKLLKESCDGLTLEQRNVVEGIYRDFTPLIEASLSPDQIQQIFGGVEKSATAAGGNRTMLGKGVDVAKKADETINKIGRWLQDTKPVQGFDAKFDQLKDKISQKFPNIADKFTKLGDMAKANPGKTAAIIGIATAIAALAGGPIGGAIAGQILRGSVELLKGEKLSTAVGKGVKTAAYGFIAGKTFELIGDALSGGIQSVRDTIFPGAQRLNFTRIFDEVGGELGDRFATFEIKDLVGQAKDISNIEELASEAASAWQQGNYGASRALWSDVQDAIEKMYTPEYVASLVADQDKRDMITQGAKAVAGLADFMGAAAQGAVAAQGSGSEQKKESVYLQTRPLSEGQVYMLFDRVSKLNEAPLDTLKKAAGTAAGYISKKAGNLTTKVTADKLASAWKGAGSPTDSAELAKFLQGQGVDSKIVDQVYTDLKISQDAGVESALTPAETWKYTNPTTGTEYEAGMTKDGQLIINFDGEWETVEDEADSKAILAARGSDDAVAKEFSQISAEIIKLPVADRILLAKHLQSKLKAA
jgi:hypothetical protein